MKLSLCPQCGSGKINTTNIITGEVACNSCDWTGKESELISRLVDEKAIRDITETVARDYAHALAQLAAQGIGQAMIAAGLITTKEPVLLGRLIKAAVGGALNGTMEEIKSIQKEIQSGEARPS